MKSIPFVFSYSHVGDFPQAVERMLLQLLQRNIYRHISERNTRAAHLIKATAMQLLQHVFFLFLTIVCFCASLQEKFKTRFHK